MEPTTAFYPSIRKVTTPNIQADSIYRIPESTLAKKTNALVDAATTISYGVAGLSSMVLFLSPFISKKAPNLEAFWTYLRKQFHPLPSADKVFKLIRDKDALQKFAYRVTMFGLLLSIIQDLQTANNTKQPSMMSSAIILITVDCITLFSKALSASPLLRTLYWPSIILYNAGKRQDIANSNNQVHRREWTPINISKEPNKIKGVAQNLKSFLLYVKDDLTKVYSRQPWVELKNEIKQDKKQEWLEPKPFMTAIAGQLYAVGGISSLLLNLPHLFQLNKSKTIWQTVNKTASLSGEVVSNLPIGARAFQSKTEMDGILTLISVPLRIVGRAFMTDKRLNLVALLHLGVMLQARGININTTKRLNTANYFKMIHALASQNPSLTASDILYNYAQNPERVSNLKKQVGQREFNFILSILQQAVQAQKFKNMPLSSFLQSIITSQPNET